MQQCWNPQVPGILTSCAEQTGACVGGGGRHCRSRCAAVVAHGAGGGRDRAGGVVSHQLGPRVSVRPGRRRAACSHHQQQPLVCTVTVAPQQLTVHLSRSSRVYLNGRPSQPLIVPHIISARSLDAPCAIAAPQMLRPVLLTPTGKLARVRKRVELICGSWWHPAEPCLGTPAARKKVECYRCPPTSPSRSSPLPSAPATFSPPPCVAPPARAPVCAPPSPPQPAPPAARCETRAAAQSRGPRPPHAPCSRCTAPNRP